MKNHTTLRDVTLFVAVLVGCASGGDSDSDISLPSSASGSAAHKAAEESKGESLTYKKYNDLNLDVPSIDKDSHSEINSLSCPDGQRDEDIDCVFGGSVIQEHISVPFIGDWKNQKKSSRDLDFHGAIKATSESGNVIGGWVRKKKTIHAYIWSYDRKTKENTATDLGEGQVNALSDDGSIAGGWAEHAHHAAIWSFSNSEWSKTYLKTGETYCPTCADWSQVNALSADGKIAGGWVTDSNSHSRAVIWHWSESNGFLDPIKLQVLQNDKPGGSKSSVRALSDNGKVAGGWEEGYNRWGNLHHAMIWFRTSESSESWSKPIDLGTGGVRALSHDGSVAGGWSRIDNEKHATLWSGSDWSIKTDLGLGQINALSDHANFAGGWSKTEAGRSVATLWRLKWPFEATNAGTANGPNTENNTDIENSTEDAGNRPDTGNNSGKPVVVAKIGVLNTLTSVAKSARDRFATIEQQRLGLGRLKDGCTPAHVGKSCYSLNGGASGFDRATDVYSGVSFGYAFSDSLASGVTIANTFSGLGNLPGDLKRDGISPGVGVWLRRRAATKDGHWYLRGAAAANRAKIKRSRSGLIGIEPGTGTSTSTGYDVVAELGRGHDLNSKIHLGYYGGLHHSDVHLSGYTETRAPGFPFLWSDATSSRTAAYAGARYRMSFDKAFSWSIQAELERDLNHQDPTLSARADGGMHYAHKSDLAHTRGQVSTELSYGFSDAFILSLNPFLEHSATHENIYGAMFRISGDF